MAFTLPTHAQLEAYRADADHVIDAVVAVLDGIERYGAWIPGLSQQLRALEELEKALRSAKVFLDHIPNPLP